MDEWIKIFIFFFTITTKRKSFGVGIAVSLMPPLVATGIGLFDPANDLAIRAGTIFLLNVVGILAGSMFTFGVLDVHKERQTIKEHLI